MSEPIKIVVTAQTAEAAAQLKTFLETQKVGFKELGSAAHGASGAMSQNRMAMMELGHVARSTAESLAFGMNPLKVLALESPRIVQSMTMLGVSLTTLVPYVAAVGAAVGAGYLGWQLYNGEQEKAAQKARDTASALEKLPDILKRITNAQNAGVISAATAEQYRQIVSGSTPLYQDIFSHAGTLTTSNFRMGPAGRASGVRFNLQPATQQQRQDYAEKLLQESGGTDANGKQTQIDAAVKLKEIHDADVVSQLAGIDKEIAAENERYEKEKANIKSQHDIVVAAGGRDASGAEAAADARHEAELARLNLKQITAEEKTQAELAKEKVDQWAQEAQAMIAATEEEKKQTAELEKQAQLKQEIAHAQAQARLDEIKSNPQLTDTEKAQESIPAMRQLLDMNAQRIAQLRQIAADPNTDATGQLVAQKQMTELMVQQAQLQNEMTAASGENSMAYQFHQAVIQLQNMNNIAKEVATTFSGVLNGGIHSISSNLTGVIMGTETWAQSLRNIYMNIMSSIVEGIIQIGVRYALTTLLMATVSRSAAMAGVAASAPIAAAQAAVWSAPATLATIASFGGAAAQAPASISLAEGIVLGTSMFGGAFADGGRPPLGMASLVGERGPELFVPDSAGTIIPADATSAMMGRRGAGGGDPANKTNLSVYPFFDMRELTNHLERNDDHEKIIVNIMSRNIHKFR
jgi:hypothetical protein